MPSLSPPVASAGFRNCEALVPLLAAMLLAGAGAAAPASPDAKPYDTNPAVFALDIPITDSPDGGLFAHDLTGDGRMDLVISSPGHLAAYTGRGERLWHLRAEIVLGRDDAGHAFPGVHAPGAIAGDMDGDGAAEVAFLLPDGTLAIHDGASGAPERSFVFAGARALAIANFRGRGDRDAVLQYGQRELRAISLEDGGTLWQVDDWWGVEHGGVRTADLDGDGLDEVLGPVLLGPDGSVLQSAQGAGTRMDAFDSLAVGDLLPGPGREVALAEQHGNNETIVVAPSRIGWRRHHAPGGRFAVGECRRNSDPDKIAVGEFDPSRAGLEVFARSSCGNHPWVMGADGTVIASWTVGRTAPAGWCHSGDCRKDPDIGPVARMLDWIRVDLLGRSSPDRDEYGIDLARAVHWDGSGRQVLFVTERHVAGQVALVDALTGAFLQIWPAEAQRTYAADIAGDFREELIVLEKADEGSLLKIFWNEAPGRGQLGSSLWDDPVYRRVRQNWNYYSP